jgi:hypothetical protein
MNALSLTGGYVYAVYMSDRYSGFIGLAADMGVNRREEGSKPWLLPV